MFDINNDDFGSNNNENKDDLINFKSADLVTEAKLKRLKEVLAANRTNQFPLLGQNLKRPSLDVRQESSLSVVRSSSLYALEQKHVPRLYPLLSGTSSDSEQTAESFSNDVTGSSISPLFGSTVNNKVDQLLHLVEHREEIMKEFDPLSSINVQEDARFLMTGRNSGGGASFVRRKSESDKHSISPLKSLVSIKENLESNARSQPKVSQLDNGWIRRIRKRIPKSDTSLATLVSKMSYRKRSECSDVPWSSQIMISPRVSYPLPNGLTSIKLVVRRLDKCNSFSTLDTDRCYNLDSSNAPSSSEPILFTCDVDSPIEQIVGHVIYTSSESVGPDMNIEHFAIKVSGLDEYLIPLTRLSDYACVHNCAKFSKDVELDFVQLPDFCFENSQDEEVIDLTFEDFSGLRKDDLIIALEIVQNETEKLIASAQSGDATRASGISQSIKMICTMLHNIQPLDLMQALSQLVEICDKISEDRKTKRTLKLISGESDSTLSTNSSMDSVPLLCRSINVVMLCLRKFLNVYVDSSLVHFEFDTGENDCIIAMDNKDAQSDREIVDLEENLLFKLQSIHNLPIDWFGTYERFYMVCYLTHGLSEISAVIKTESAQLVKNYGDFLKIDQWLVFDRNLICTLPRDARICFVLFGTKIELEPNENSAPQSVEATQVGQAISNSPVPIRSIIEVQLCWTSYPLFDSDRCLVQGSYFMPSSASAKVEPWGPPPYLSDLNKSLPVFLVQFPCFDFKYRFPSLSASDLSRADSSPIDAAQMNLFRKSFTSLDYDQQQLLEDILQHGSILDIDDKELLWEKRFYLTDKPEALPMVLKSALSWDWACLGNVYNLLNAWCSLDTGRALELLLPEFPDGYVRNKAVFWLEKNGPDELCNVLPQLTEALSFETHEDSSLVELLLSFSLRNRRFAFTLFWQLDERKSRSDPFSKRCSNLQCCLISLLGPEFTSKTNLQKRLIQQLDSFATDLKECKESERKKFINTYANRLDGELLSCHVNLPIYPSVVATGVDWRKCRFFESLTLPVKICFRTTDPNSFYDVLNKLGDDLRQDNLVLQLMRLMDDIWSKDGLDLRMLIYKCMSTGMKKGIIEMVPDCKTLREIHVLEGGVTGALKDNLIGKWLQKQNPCELDYLAALNNFRRSCAGWCVGTFILGIGDRHNDNIMITSKGHVFHIDFGKYLGDTENFGSFKRDRTPFVLTSDMVDVINCGETKATTFFQDFVDYGCKAFNIVRNNHALFINLMKLMLRAGVPGLSEEAVRYVCANLWLDHSDSEASVRFTRMIEESMNNRFPKWNFLVHTIAQQRKAKHGTRDTSRLSFVPNIYSLETDGRLESVELMNCEKWKIPEKVYMYRICVNRVNVRIPAYIFRSYKEIYELSACLCIKFPLSKLPILPKDKGLGRTNVREIAERRKPFVANFLSALFSSSDELAHCDLVYTFFHSILRDDPVYSTNKSVDSMGQQGTAELNAQTNEIRGELKLCIEYKKNCLEIFVQHARNLALTNSSLLPDSYVKCYLRPDFNRRSKRKTRIIRKAQNPTYNEALIYPWSLEMLMDKVLEISVWHSDVLKENSFIGGLQLNMKDLLRLPNKKLSQWFRLGNIVSKRAL